MTRETSRMRKERASATDTRWPNCITWTSSTGATQFLLHPAIRALTSGCSINTFIMTVYDIFLYFGGLCTENDHSHPLKKLFPDQSEVSTIPAG